MPSLAIYIDESGDLGWNFESKFRHGGSSRYLTIAALCVPLEKIKYSARTIKKLYYIHGWNPKEEKKWSKMTVVERKSFVDLATSLHNQHPDIGYRTITVYKPNVLEHIRKDPNKLYNYMVGLLLSSVMSECDKVIFIPDIRSIKVASGNSMYDYLVTKIWFNHGATTEVIHKPSNSANEKGIQFADMLSGVVQKHFEDNDSEIFNSFSKKIILKKLYHK